MILKLFATLFVFRINVHYSDIHVLSLPSICVIMCVAICMCMCVHELAGRRKTKICVIMLFIIFSNNYIITNSQIFVIINSSTYSNLKKIMVLLALEAFAILSCYGIIWRVILRYIVQKKKHGSSQAPSPSP